MKELNLSMSNSYESLYQKEKYQNNFVTNNILF